MAAEGAAPVARTAQPMPIPALPFRSVAPRAAALLPAALLSAAPVLAAPVLAAPLLTAAPAGAQGGRVPVMPVEPDAPEAWREGPGRRNACIDAGRIAGAYVVDPHTLEVVLHGGGRLRVKFQRPCPQLSYYGGFYYAPAEAGRLCAGRDRILGRAGGACPISRIVPLVPVRPR